MPNLHFLIKQVARGTVALTREQTSAMGLSDFIIPERKGKQAMSVDQWNATEGMMKSCSESSRANETVSSVSKQQNYSYAYLGAALKPVHSVAEE